jgi:hypothetical protein
MGRMCGRKGRGSEKERKVREEKEGQVVDRWEECVEGRGSEMRGK